MHKGEAIQMINSMLHRTTSPNPCDALDWILLRTLIEQIPDAQWYDAHKRVAKLIDEAI